MPLPGTTPLIRDVIFKDNNVCVHVVYLMATDRQTDIQTYIVTS